MMAIVLAATVVTAAPETLPERFSGTLINEADLAEAIEARRTVWLGPVVLAGASMLTLGSSFLLLALGAAGGLSVAVPILVFGLSLVLHAMTVVAIIVALVDATRLDARIEELRERSQDARASRESFGAVLARF